MPKRRVYLENVPGINVDTRSDTTRKGYHEGTIPYGAGSELNVLGPVGLAIKGLDELDRQTNMTREDSPIYHPGLITGEAPSVGLKGVQGVMAVKQANAAKNAVNTGRIRSMKEASKLSGKKYNSQYVGNGKVYNNNAITANDVFNETKTISGSPIVVKKEPIVIGRKMSNMMIDANDYIKKNKLSTFMGPNGKMYVRTGDGKVRSMESFARDFDSPWAGQILQK